MKEATQRFLAFSLCSEEYAIPLLKVREVIALSDNITPVPHSEGHFRGIMNLRGQVISVLDLRLKFKMKATQSSGETAIVILDLDDLCLGVIVDAINMVMAVEPGDINPPPDVASPLSSRYVTGVTRRDKKLILLIDIEAALGVEEIKAIKAAANASTAQAA